VSRTPSKALAARTVAKWQAKPEATMASRLGSAIMAGEWTDVHSARAIGAKSSNLNQVVDVLRAAGIALATQNRSHGAKAYRAKAARGASTKRTVVAEQAGLTHPHLGAVLTVRALALDEDGELVMQVSNGTGGWLVKVTGHVG
jgi:isoaspartyl peptidase/L-asparaginase-like protein (Ntn-hydrolase superfamily)